MHSHPIFCDLLARVIVLIPEKSLVISVFPFHQEAVEHLFIICHDGDWLHPETTEDSDQCIVKVGSADQHIPLCLALESKTTRIFSVFFFFFFWMIHAKNR